jgi:hypothetical protein
MTYKNILKDCVAMEEGDFLIRYRINNNEFVVYSATKGKIECLETHTFTNLTPYELIVNLNTQPPYEMENEEEFKFEKLRSKDEIVRYLFDIDKDSSETLQNCRVDNAMGYLLKDISTPNKIRNFYKFNGVSYNLLFENKICLASVHENIESNVISLCWNPYIFSMIEKTEEKTPSYLLASDNPILYAHILKIINDKSYNRLNLYVGDNIIEAFGFFCSYMNHKNNNKNIDLYHNDSEITLVLKNWNPLSILKMVSKAQSDCNNYFKEKITDIDYKNDYKVYNCNSINQDSYITCKNNKIFVMSLFTTFLSFLKADEICSFYD